MHRVPGILFALAMLVSACGTPVDTTATALAQTQAYQRDMATALAGTVTASAPTKTRTPRPPTPTSTSLPSPTPSGKFEFFDAAVKQVNENEVAVTFGYQIQKDVKLEGLMLGAWPEGCGQQMFNMSFTPFLPGDAPSGVVPDANAVTISFRKPGQCDATGVQIFVFRQGGGNIYQQSFDLPFSLEMK